MSGIISASSQSSASASDGGDRTTESYQRQRGGGVSGKDRRKYLDPRLQDELAERI